MTPAPPPPPPPVLPAPLVPEPHIRRAPPPLHADMGSHDRHMTAQMCHLLGLMIIVVGIAGGILECLGVSLVLPESNRFAVWPRQVMAQVIAVAVLRAGLGMALGGFGIALSRRIRTGAMGSVWTALCVAAVFAFFDVVFTIYLIIISLLNGPDAIWQLFPLVIGLMLLGKLLYHGTRTVMLRSGAKLNSHPPRESTDLVQSAKHLLLVFRSRPALLSFAAVLLLANVLYIAFIGAQASRFLREPLPPPAKPHLPFIPPLAREKPLFRATAPYTDDVFDPVLGMKRADRQKVIDAVKTRWDFTEQQLLRLDRYLRQVGRAVVGPLPADMATLRFSREDRNGYEHLKFANGRFSMSGFGSAHWNEGSGSKSGTLDSYDEIWRTSGDRYASHAMERAINRIVKNSPEVTPLEAGAILQAIRGIQNPYIGVLNLDVSRDNDCFRVKLSDRDTRNRFRIDKAGNVYDDSPQATYEFQKKLAASKEAIAQAESNRSYLQQAHIAATEKHFQESRAMGRLKYVPLALLMDAVIGLLLGLQLFVALLRRDLARLIRCKTLAVVSLIVGVVTWSYLAYFAAQVPSGNANLITVSIPALLFLACWRIAQLWFPWMSARQSAEPVAEPVSV